MKERMRTREEEQRTFEGATEKVRTEVRNVAMRELF